MKITIDIPDQYVPLLSKWASVARTLNEAKRICYYTSGLTDNEFEVERASHCGKELNDLVTPLDTLHYIARAEIWKQKKMKTLRKFFRVISISSDKRTILLKPIEPENAVEDVHFIMIKSELTLFIKELEKLRDSMKAIQ